jgi:hypothetical protein
MSDCIKEWKPTPRWKWELERILDIIKNPVKFIKWYMNNGGNIYVKYAKSEFKRMKYHTPDAIVLRYQKEIISILKKLKKEGLSGGSAPYYAGILGSTVKNLALLNVISPVYCTNNEFYKAYGSDEDEDACYQNSLQSSIFKDGYDARPYFIDAIIFRDDRGSTFTSGNCAGYSSAQYVKKFPFMPKKFTVDVVYDKKKDSYTIKDQKQIDEVFEYYDLFPLEERRGRKKVSSTDKQKKNGKNRA